LNVDIGGLLTFQNSKLYVVSSHLQARASTCYSQIHFTESLLALCSTATQHLDANCCRSRIHLWKLVLPTG